MSELTIVQAKEGECSGLRQVLFSGVRIPACIPFDWNFESALPQYLTRADDVWITTYPKSSTHWVSEIVWQLYNERRTSDTKLDKRVRLFEGSKLLSSNTADSRPSLESLSSPRLIRSHLPFHVIPKAHCKETQCKYIYVARNPKDVVVSYFHMVNSIKKDVSGFQGSFEFYAKIFTQGEVSYGSWHEHVVGWWKHRNDPNVLFLKYEDLKMDLEAGVRKIAAFLQKSLQEETIKAITKQCTFKEMNNNRSVYTVPVSDGPHVLRKGEIGDWKHLFTPELNEEFEVKILSKLKGTGLSFDFE